MLDSGNVELEAQFILLFLLFLLFLFPFLLYSPSLFFFFFFFSAHTPQRMLGSCDVVKFPEQLCFILFFSRELLGGEESWPFLLASNAVPALIQLMALPWFPESPRYLLIDRGDRESCISGEFRVTVSPPLSTRDLLTGQMHSKKAGCILVTYCPAGSVQGKLKCRFPSNTNVLLVTLPVSSDAHKNFKPNTIAMSLVS